MKKTIVAISAVALALSGGTSAWADPATSASANAYGADVSGSLLGTIIERTPEVDSVLPPGGVQEDDILPLDVDPVTVSITGRVVAETQVESTIEPFPLLDNQGLQNARGLAEIESLDLLLEGAEVVGPVDELARNALVSADAVYAEAVASCQGTTPVYATDSDVINLRIADSDVELVDGVVDGVIGLVNDVGDLLPDALRIHIATDQAGATADGGRFVNALRITVGATEIDPVQDQDSLIGILDPGDLLGGLNLAGTRMADDGLFAIAQVDGTPLIDVTLAHAEVGPLTCGAGGPGGPDGPPECSDGIDNDGDGVIDFPADPGCDSPEDDDERNECTDGIDNDGDGVIDFPADPGCDSPEDDDERNQCVDGVDNDGDGLIDFGADPGCASPEDDDERNGGDAGGAAGGGDDQQRRLPATGGGVTSPLLGLAVLGLAGAVALRRRVLSVSPEWSGDLRQ